MPSEPLPALAADMPLCRLDTLPDGGARGFDLTGSGQDTVFAVRRGAQVKVYRNSCPHADSPLPWRKDAYLNRDGSRIVCFAHGALFDIDSGACVLGPCLGQSLEAVPHRIGRNAQGHALVVLLPSA